MIDPADLFFLSQPNGSKYYESLILNAPYRYAKSMPWIPHHYSLREEWKDVNLWNEVVMFIKRYGVPEEWGKKKEIHFYYYINGYKYWALGAPEVTVLNRIRLPKVQPPHPRTI